MVNPLDAMYKPGFFKNRHKLAWRAPIVCEAIVELLNPKSVVDLGCGVGDLVQGFLDLGIDAMGLEGTENVGSFLMIPKEKIVFADLCYPLFLTRKFDLTLCLEVAEHIEEKYVDPFCNNIVKMTKRHIVLTAAPPGQLGHFHVNLQYPKYWIEKFLRYGFLRQIAIEEKLRSKWENWKSKPGILAYYQNIMVFEK